MRVSGSIVVVFLVLVAGGHGHRDAAAEPVGVTVRVVDEAGTALPDVRVSLRTEKRHAPEFLDPQPVARGETGATGSVRFEGLAPDARYTLVATAPDVRWKELADRCLVNWEPKDVTVTLAAAIRLAGTVTASGGAAVPFARVVVEIGRWESATFADKDGKFEFANAPQGDATLYAEVDRKGNEPVRGSPITLPSNTTSAEVILRSVPSDRQQYLMVRVTTPGGRPVMHATGWFHASSRSSRGFSSSVSSMGSVSGGCARTTEFSKKMRLEVSGARSEFGEPLPCGPGRGGPYGPGPREGTLELPAEKTILGRVVGPDGKPLVGIRVRAHPEETLSGFGMWLGMVHSDGISGPDGQFRIGGLDGRKYALRAVETLDYVGGEATAAGESTDAKVAMRAAVAPTFTFKDEAGKPVARAIVRVKRPPRDRMSAEGEDEEREAETDASGVARIRGLDPQGKYEFNAFPPAGRDELLAWTFKRWQPQDLALTFERGRRIAGVVRDQGRAAVPGARVEYARVASGKKTGGEKGAKPAASKPHVATAGPDGRFVLEGLRPGKYTLLARRPPVPRKGTGPAPPEPKDASRPVKIATETEDVSLLLRMPDVLHLRVWAWDKSIGKPNILLAAVGDEGAGPKVVKKRLDKNGEVVFKDLRWNVEYAAWMGLLKDGKYVYRTGIRPQDVKVTLRVEQGTSVTGKLVAPKGTKSRKIFAVFPGFFVPGKFKTSGRFEIRGLPPGPWTLRGCGKLSKELIETDVECKPGEEPVITLVKK